MADYILHRKTRNSASVIVHILLNLVFGIGTVLVTILTKSPIFGILLVLLSKWRVFAVRPRYLWINIKSNLLDFIVGVSVVILTYYSGAELLPADFILIIFYCVWLIIIKPLTSEVANLIQSLTAVFFGISASTFLSANVDSIVIVLCAFVVGYSASRHVLSQGNEQDFALTTMVAGLVFAEVAWLCHSWMIIYTFGSTGIRIPQLAIILTIFAYVYNSIRITMINHDEKLRFREIAAPVIFGIVTIGAILIWFSNPIFNI